jgi:RHS repeat-associated protein
VYRLTNETISLDPHSKNGSVDYGLDPVGNRLSQSSTLPGTSTGSFTYDANDRLSTETYDANGNTLSTGGRTFAFDFENRIKSANGGAVTIIYDGDGNRVAKTVGGVTTRYLLDDLNPTHYSQVVEELVNGSVQRTYTYGRRHRISQNQFINGTWTASFYGYDGFGSVRTLTDSTGTITDTYDYDAWGNAVNTTGSTPNAYLYRGEQYDADLGLYYLRARYFNPVTGRFLVKDPAKGSAFEPKTLHQYLYVHGDPVNHVDPKGRMEYTMILGWLSEPAGIAAAAGASLAVACVGEPIVAGMSMAMAAALGYEIYDVRSSGTCPMILTFSWRERVDRLPSPPPDIDPPGNCTPERLRELMQLQEIACTATPCTAGENRLSRAAKVLKMEACIGARLDVMVECFEGGDAGHQGWLDVIIDQINDCIEFGLPD